jgi:hypothetical protein
LLQHHTNWLLQQLLGQKEHLLTQQLAFPSFIRKSTCSTLLKAMGVAG